MSVVRVETKNGSTQEEQKSGTNWYLVGGAVAAALIGTVAIATVLQQKRRTTIKTEADGFEEITEFEDESTTLSNFVEGTKATFMTIWGKTVRMMRGLDAIVRRNLSQEQNAPLAQQESSILMESDEEPFVVGL